MFNSIEQLVETAVTQEKSIADAMISQEMEVTGRPYLDVYEDMDRNLEVMESAVEEGIGGVTSTTGLTGMDAVKMQEYIESGKGISGDLTLYTLGKRPCGQYQRSERSDGQDLRDTYCRIRGGCARCIVRHEGETWRVTRGHDQIPVHFRGIRLRSGEQCEHLGCCRRLPGRSGQRQRNGGSRPR